MQEYFEQIEGVHVCPFRMDGHVASFVVIDDAVYLVDTSLNIIESLDEKDFEET
jgi:hypothetical protein